MISSGLEQARLDTHPTVSPQVGSLASYMKLPTKAHIEDIRRVTGMKTDVAIITGRTKI